MGNIFSRQYLMIISGLILGAVAALMTVAGNPANMGICLACFYRDITGALGLHRAATVQYLRPEIMGMVLGGFLSALAWGEFRARGGSAPLVRFFLGAFFMIGAMVFLGCPVRAVLRLAGGDLNGLTGIAGVIAGALIGIYLLRNGFNLGRSTPTYSAAGWIMPLFMLGLLLLAVFKPQFILASKEGPGAARAPLLLALGAGLLFGFLAQRTRMCFVGGWRDLFLVKDTYLFSGIVAFFVGALIINALFGKIHVGFVNQPIAHSSHLWNFLGMTLAGLTATLLGGCPLRQTILAAEGDLDAGITLWGIIAGAAFAHNFGLASSPQGPSALGPVAVLLGIAFALAVGLLMREKV